MLTGAITKRDDGQVQEVLAAASDASRESWQRLALLRGIREAARSPSQWARPGSRPRVVASLAARPDEFLALVSSDDRELAREAAATEPYLTWPGRETRAPEPSPLTEEEQARLASGRDIYTNLCSACHGPDGGGVAAMAPALIESRWVLGSAGLAARIVLHGKESEQLMPPLGNLTDDQVAAVLTYVRRAWGHAASPVTPAIVREARGASTGRTRPWTEAELEAVTQPDGPGR
jgi:mono/diheme cytochrome c family protein